VQRWTPDQQRTTPKGGALRSIRGTTVSHLNIHSENCHAEFSNRVRKARD